MLETGNSAPNFNLKDQNGLTHNLTDYLGKWILVYFYPKDDTPGCTQEACTISEVYEDFIDNKVVVFGISEDSPDSHLQFAKKYNLPFTLLSDINLETIKDYHAINDENLLRISYLIDPEGSIARAYPEVDPATHAAELLRDIKEIKS